MRVDQDKKDSGNNPAWEIDPKRQVPQWYALYTRSHCEQSVATQLAAKGFQVFLPSIEIWSRRAGQQHRIMIPMFPSYLFLHHPINKMSYIEICNVRGLVRILNRGWEDLQSIPEREIDTIRKVTNASIPIVTHPYLTTGQRVRIMYGALAGVEGILVQSNPGKGLIVLSVELLRRSIAVEVECSVIDVA